MKIFICSALAASLFVAPAMAQTEAAPPKTEARPADVAGQIEQDLGGLTRSATKGYFDSVRYISDARYGYFGASEWIKQLRRTLQYGTIEIDSVRVLEQNGNDARAAVAYKIVPPNSADAKTRQFWSATHQEIIDLKLRTDARVWRVVPPQTAPPAIETADSIADQDVLMANIAYHIAQKQMPISKGTPDERSMNNLKQVALGAFMFAQDYAQVFAFDDRHIVEAITPYVVGPTAFQIPDTKEIYTFNDNLSGLNVAAINEVAQTVLFYEGQNETPIFRYDGRAAICFTDGHVALVTPDEAQKLIWKP